MAINQIQFPNNIMTSGQPSLEEYLEICQKGYCAIINLATSQSQQFNSKADHTVIEKGVAYIHIPVSWQLPTLANYRCFEQILQLFDGELVWVHCAINFRVTAFMYIYCVTKLQMPVTEAQQLIERVWRPEPHWQKFIDSLLSKTL